MDNEARILLDDVIAFCRRDGRETRLINMLEQCGATGFDDESLTIQVPSRFAYNYLVKQRELIERYLEEISFMPMVLNVVVAEGGAPSFCLRNVETSWRFSFWLSCVAKTCSF